MPRTYLPLLPIPVLAIIVAVSACSKTRPADPVSHVIPPPSSYLAAVAPGLPPEGASPIAAAPANEEDEAPSADEVKAFERAVAK